jgi:hypothetical protein
MNAIEVEKLSRTFNGLKAVDNISFSVEAVEIFGFLATTEKALTRVVYTVLIAGLFGYSDALCSHLLSDRGAETVVKWTRFVTHLGTPDCRVGLYRNRIRRLRQGPPSTALSHKKSPKGAQNALAKSFCSLCLFVAKRLASLCTA